MSVDLFVREAGLASAPTLVFLHGGGVSGWMWDPQVEALRGAYHCLAPDLPEQGRSAAVKPFSITDGAARVAELIRQRAHGGKATVIGLSLGAQVTTALLAHAPEVVERAIISSALLRPLPGASIYRPWLFRASYWSAIGPLKWWKGWIRLNMRYSAGVPDAYFPQFLADFRAQTADAFTHVMCENMGFRQPAGLERVTAPTLVVVGRREYAAMQQSARDLVAAIPGARGCLATVGRSLAENHNWSLYAPALFTQMVRAWIEGTPLPDVLSPF